MVWLRRQLHFQMPIMLEASAPVSHLIIKHGGRNNGELCN